MLHLTTLTDTHTHTQTYSVGPLWTRDQFFATHNIYKRNINATGRPRTRIASTQIATYIRLIPRSHRIWRLWSYELENDGLRKEV